jgi:hypothetical protein
MSIFVQDGTGSGKLAAVSSENQLKVEAENHAHQYHVSAVNGQVYQALSTTTSVSASATTNLLHIKNNSPTLDLVVTFIRIDAVVAGTLPAAGCYYDVGFDEEYSSGGTAITPANMNRKSGNIADATIYGNNPTVTGSLVEIDKHYVSASGDENTYNKQGSMILGQNNTLTIRLVTDTGNTGEAVARVTFMMIANGA